jgi:hypothetical protein
MQVYWTIKLRQKCGSPQSGWEPPCLSRRSWTSVQRKSVSFQKGWALALDFEASAKARSKADSFRNAEALLPSAEAEGSHPELSCLGAWS